MYREYVAQSENYSHFMSLLKAVIKQRNNDTDYTEVAFENDVFVMRPYSEWDGEPMMEGDEPSELDLPNFEHKRTRTMVSWYKHIGRGMTIVEKGNFLDIVCECINSLKVNNAT